LLDFDRTLEARHTRTQIALERGDIEATRLGDRTRALKVVVVAHALITDARERSI
jgi:hypothetical protein